MINFRYHQNNSNHTVLLKKHKGKNIAQTIHVDDMVVTKDDFEESEGLQRHLSKEFEMKGLSLLKYFLAIEVS